MTANQTPNAVSAKVLSALDAILEREKPEIILVQGDTTTAFVYKVSNVEKLTNGTSNVDEMVQLAERFFENYLAG